MNANYKITLFLPAANRRVVKMIVADNDADAVKFAQAGVGCASIVLYVS